MILLETTVIFSGKSTQKRPFLYVHWLILTVSVNLMFYMRDDFFCISNRSVHWNYCVLDEGHIIKNGKTKACYFVTELPRQ